MLKKNLKTKKITCQFTGEELGEIGYDADKYPTEPTLEELGYVDARCDQCELDYGNFKSMMLEFKVKTDKSWKEAEDFVKINRKKVDFDKELKKEKSKS